MESVCFVREAGFEDEEEDEVELFELECLGAVISVNDWL